MAGIEDCYTSARGSTGTLGNFGTYILNISYVLNRHSVNRLSSVFCKVDVVVLDHRLVVFGAVIFLTVKSTWPQCRRVKAEIFCP